MTAPVVDNGLERHPPGDLLERYTLGNGLRVLLAPTGRGTAVGISVHYDVGMRSEPPGRTGFAHLFEHLMFQGSANLPKLAHFRYVESSGGVFNGSTHLDYTQYYEILPSNALERGLFLEADRMRAPVLSETNLRLQVDVVKEEIRVNVTNKPYGGFPWLRLPAVLFETFANTHDGYGSFADLEQATATDAAQFFDRYYVPANALLCVTGAFDPADAARLVERHFGDIPRRPAPARADFGEPDLTTERHRVVYDRHAPLPGLAIGWRVPDPINARAEYLPYLLLARIMSDGAASRLEQRLVRRDGIASQKACYLGLLGDPFDVRDPTALVVSARHPVDVPAGRVLDAIDEEFRRVAADGLRDGELRRAAASLTTSLLRDTAAILGRTHALAALELQHGRAELLAELPGLLASVTADEVRRAAGALTVHRRAVVELRPGTAAGRADVDGAGS